MMIYNERSKCASVVLKKDELYNRPVIGLTFW